MGWQNPPIPWREFERRLSWHGDVPRPPGDTASQALPEPPEPPPGPDPVPWAELHCHSAYSFLDGCTMPDVLVREAVRLGIETLAVTDHDGMYGAVQLAQAADGTSVRTVFGAELSLGLSAPQNGVADPEGRHLLVLARGPEGYRRLCRTISAAQLAGRQKGRPVYDLGQLADAHQGGWAVLTGCRKGAVPAALAAAGPDAAERELRTLVDMFGAENVYAELVDHDQPLDDERNDMLAALAGTVGVDVVASNNVHYVGPREADLATAVAAVRARRSLDDMAGWLPATRTAHLRSAGEMATRLARFPGVLQTTAALGRDCAFDFRQMLAPELPDRQLPPGSPSEADHLRELTYRGAAVRYGARSDSAKSAEAYRQIDHELDVIISGGYTGYFLIVHEIVTFCAGKQILCQGRGSAANSAVCYALGITHVDSVKHGLLFERFLSASRDGPPDIDLDIENARREEVIQHVYDLYGRERSAQVANVITYRPKMALRDAAKALGHSTGQRDAWTKLVGLGESDTGSGGTDDEVPPDVAALAVKFADLPRHLGIHSGGMVMCDRPVGEVCPVEWARMENRSVLQWDKEDCAWLGLIKIDLLGLGMLSALHDAFDLVEEHHGKAYGLHDVPPDDRSVYDMLCAADTIGVFQVESRAQMATLPRLRPRTFYDLVVEVSLIRPGPIQGGSVHPYLRRRFHQEERKAPHPLMEKALKRTYGVPLFQEQMMQIAIDCAGFSGQEADELRQAMSSKRSEARIAALRERLLRGMRGNGVDTATAEDIYVKLHGFAGFGFPESHAMSFAHLVYVSAYLKRYYPAVFTAALLRNQPMGFYGPHTLVGDARRHGVTVHGVDVNASGVKAKLEPGLLPVTGHHDFRPEAEQPAIRMGLGSVRSLGTDAAQTIVDGQPYTSVEDLARRTRLRVPALEALAVAGAFGCFGLTRREALWAAGGLAGIRADQLDGSTPGLPAPELPAMAPIEETFADLWATGSSTSHPVQHVRAELADRGVQPAEALLGLPNATRVTVAGVVTHRQRPPTAGGVVFVNLEDETGLVNVICPPTTYERARKVVLRSAALVVSGRLERVDGAVSVLAERVHRLSLAVTDTSRNWR